MEKLRVLGVCAGAGVMVHPFKEYLIGNIEPRPDYKTPNDIQWELNFKGIPREATDFKNVDIIIGHPSCGHSSALAYSRGKKLGDGKGDPTMNLFIESVNKYKPKVFLFENLTALFKSFPENEFDEAFGDYKLIKYNVSMGAFGNSQVSRQRLVVIGIRKGIKSVNSSNFMLPSKENIKLKRVFQLEANLKYPDTSLCHVREPDNKVVCMEKDFKKLTLAEVKVIWNSPKFLKLKKWDATTTGKGNMKNLPGVYRNLSHDYPLTARKQNRQFNSLGDIMSPRELARIQGLPDSFKIWYDYRKDQYSINKGRVSVTKCPPYELGNWFYNCIYNSNLKSKSNGNQKKQVVIESSVLPRSNREDDVIFTPHSRNHC